MKHIADLLFEAMILKKTPRSGFHFLGVGKESVAEHSFSTAFIAYTMSKMIEDIDSLKLISICLVHDLPEARTGDHNYVQKKYVAVDEEKAIIDATRNIPFGNSMSDLIMEYNAQETIESQLAYDADQLSFILDLKTVKDIGCNTPEQWLPVVQHRLKTDIGKQLAEAIMSTKWDAWWMDGYEE